VLRDLLFAVWFLLPAGVANATPVVVAKVPVLARFTASIDGGRTWHGQPILGKNKTWRGLLSGILTATLVLWLQQLIVTDFPARRWLTGPLDYAMLPTLLLGPLLGFGALAGDAVESFFKRRASVPSGNSWFPFDQVDYIIGACVAALPVVRLPLISYVWLLLVWMAMHLLFSYVGYLLKLKDKPI
jgi:CDP-2,3-bis-(O-geranylgeranyl)-sn-glycerol synthase